MKAVINEKETPVKPKYPYLGKFVSDVCEYIVLFSRENTGVVVFNKHSDEYSFSSDFAEELFTPFTGSITLSND